MIPTATISNTARPEWMPEHVWMDIGNTLAPDFLERIKDPEVKRQFDERGAAVEARVARQKGGQK